MDGQTLTARIASLEAKIAQQEKTIAELRKTLAQRDGASTAPAANCTLTLACTALNIRLLHRPPRDPPAGGLIERFFRTVQEQLERPPSAAIANSPIRFGPIRTTAFSTSTSVWPDGL